MEPRKNMRFTKWLSIILVLFFIFIIALYKMWIHYGFEAIRYDIIRQIKYGLIEKSVAEYSGGNMPGDRFNDILKKNLKIMHLDSIYNIEYVTSNKDKVAFYLCKTKDHTDDQRFFDGILFICDMRKNTKSLYLSVNTERQQCKLSEDLQ